MKAYKVHENFYNKVGTVAQMVEQQEYFSLLAKKVPMNSSCVSQVRVLPVPQNN